MNTTENKNINLENLSRFKNKLVVTLTQAEYDLLSDKEKNSDTIYFISDENAAITDSDKDYIDNKSAETLQSSKNYSDEKISTLIDNAPEELNTLKKIATVIQTNNSAIDTLNTDVENKVDKSDLVAITNDEIDLLITQAEEAIQIE